MRPPVKSIAADAWQVRERIPPRTWRESTVERRVERGDHGHAYPECCLDALERGTVVKRSKAAELAQLVQQRNVHAHHVAQPVASMDHPVCNGVWKLRKALQCLRDRRAVSAADLHRATCQRLNG
jgi:hypothetical protein